MPLFLPVIEAFNRGNVSYVIVGGLATVLHGHLRITADMDCIIALDPQNTSRAVAILQSLGYLPRLPVDPNDFAREEVRRQWIEQRAMRVFSFHHPDRPVESIDLFADYPMEYSGLFARSELEDLGGVHARVCCLADLIALKRAAGRPIDLDDVRALEAIHRHGA